MSANTIYLLLGVFGTALFLYALWIGKNKKPPKSHSH